MKTLEAFRQSLISQLEHALVHPAIWGGSGSGIQQFFEMELGHLSWIDERSADLGAVKSRIFEGHSQGIIGALASQHLNWPDYASEVASVYAQLFYALGYWKPARLLTEPELSGIRGALSDVFFQRDWNESEIVATFGPPSHTVGDIFTIVHAYASSDKNQTWIYFDFARRARPVDWDASLDDPQLRDVRFRGQQMTLLPSARRSRVGREILVGETWVPADPSLLSNPGLTHLDIDGVIADVRKLLPGVVIERLQPRHPADTFAIWYFGWEQDTRQISLSSLVGWAPYFVFTPERPTADEDSGWAQTREEAVEQVVNYLNSIRDAD